MAYVSFPRDVAVRGLRWQPPFDTAQSNRSEFTGGRQVVELPGGGRWRASGEFVPMIGQANSFGVRRFLANLRGPLNIFALPAWEKRQTASAITRWPIALPINSTNCTVTGNTAVKVAGGGGFNASARTTGGWAGGVTLTFRNGAFGALFCAGISTAPAADDNFTSVEHGLIVRENGQVDVLIFGVTLSNKGWSGPGSLFSIDFEPGASQVRYYVDGALIHTETYSSAAVMYFDSSISTMGGTISDICFFARTPIAAGSTTAVLYGFPVSTANAVTGGWFATALFTDGTTQLLTVKDPTDSFSDTSAGVTFDAPLRKTAYHIVLDYPFALMSLSDGAEWGVDPGQIYSAGFTAEEAW